MSVHQTNAHARRQHRRSARLRGNQDSIPSQVPPARTGVTNTDVLQAAQVKVHLQGMQDGQGNPITNRDTLVDELIRSLGTCTSMANWEISLNTEVFKIRLHGGIVFTLPRLRLLLQALLSRFTVPITDVAGWQAINPFTNLSGQTRVLKAQCLRAYNELVQLGTRLSRVSIPPPFPTPDPPASIVEADDSDGKEGELDNAALMEQGWDYNPTAVQQAEVALRPLSKYNVSDILQAVKQAFSQAGSNVDTRTRRDNLLPCIYLYKQLHLETARYVNLDVQYDQENHDNVKYDMVDNSLSTLGVNSIADMYEMGQYYSNNGVSEKSKLKAGLKQMNLITDGFEKNIPNTAEQALCGVGNSNEQLFAQLNKDPVDVLQRESIEILELDPTALLKKRTLADALATLNYTISAGKNSYRRNAKAVYQYITRTGVYRHVIPLRTIKQYILQNNVHQELFEAWTAYITQHPEKDTLKDLLMFILKHYTGTEFVIACEKMLLQKIDASTSVSTVISRVTTALEYYNYAVECYNVNHPHTDFEPKDNKAIKNIFINQLLPEVWINILQSENALGGCRSVQQLMTILDTFDKRLDADQYAILRDSAGSIDTAGISSDSALRQRMNAQEEELRRMKANNSRISNELNKLKNKSTGSTSLQGSQFGKRKRRTSWNTDYGARGGARGQDRRRDDYKDQRQDSDYKQSNARSFNTPNQRRNQRGGRQRNNRRGQSRGGRNTQPRPFNRRNNQFKGNCFNCMKYGHGKNNCPDEIDEKRVALNREKFMKKKKAAVVAFMNQPPTKRRKTSGNA